MSYLENILYSAIVGDALGVPFEFKERGSFVCQKLQGGGTWGQPLGSWSDDTSFSLALIDNFNQAGDYADLMRRFEAYVMTGAYTPTGEVFDLGQTCVKAVRNFSVNNYPPTECGDASEFANGNGAIMRLAPLAIVLRDETDLAKRLRLTKEYTSLTHRHPRAILGSYLYLELLHELLNGVALPEALQNLPARVANCPEAVEISAYQPLFDDNYPQTAVEQIKSTGYVVDTLLSAVWAVLTTDSIDAAILRAVNLGSDTDTVATVAATIAACWHREQRVNPKWRRQLLNQELLKNIINPFLNK